MVGDLLSALAMIQAEPDGEPIQAACALVAAIEDQVVHRLDLDCPDDVPDALGLQDNASRVAAQATTPLDLSDLPAVWLRSSIRFEYLDGLWVLPAPAAYLETRQIYPRRAGSRRLEGRCHVRMFIAADGSPHNIEPVCEAYRLRSGTVWRNNAGFPASTIAAVRQWRFFTPLDEHNRCVTTVLEYRLDAGGAGPERAWSDVPIPDALTCARRAASPP